ncbi:MAG: FHA domain-containing protein [Bacteroidota bacterium]
MSGLIALVLRLLLALALYGFLAWALYTLWTEIRREAGRVLIQRTPGISLTVYKSGAPALVKHFIQPEIILGRDPVCDIPIADETVSARHARLAFHHSQWWVEDLDSTNGTRLNRALITRPTVLTAADQISLGQIQILVGLAVDSNASATQRITE